METMTSETVSRASDERDRQSMAVFRQLLVNTLISGVTSSFLWFALTFWVYLERVPWSPPA